MTRAALEPGALVAWSVVAAVAAVVSTGPASAQAASASPAALDVAALDDAVLAADAVVTGRLDAVLAERREWTAESGARVVGRRGTADLTVIESLWGDLPPGATVRLEWTELDPGAERHRAGEQGFYLLVCAGEGESPAARCAASEGGGHRAAEQAFRPVSERAAVIDALRRHPLRIEGPPRMAAGAALPVTIVLRNAGDSPLELPGFRLAGGALERQPGFRLAVRQGAADGPEAPARFGKVRTSAAVPPTVVPPGARLEFNVDLQQLFMLTRPGVHVVDVGLEGFPRQPPHVFRLAGSEVGGNGG